MLRLLALSSALLAGCWSASDRLNDCMFGGATQAQAEECAVRNFGAKAAKELRERQEFCRNICKESDAPECVVNCPPTH